MKKIILALISLACSIDMYAQNLQGTIVYSHHNSASLLNADTIYSINDAKQKTFITLGFRPRVSHNGNYLALEKGPQSNQGFQAAIWLRDLISHTETLAIPNTDFIEYFDFSPDDSHVVYDQGCSLFTSKTDGTNVIDIACTPCDCYSDHPSLRLADSLVVYHNVHFALYTKNFDGNNVQQIPNTYPGDLYPVWSPDGQWITYYKLTPGFVFTSGSYVTNSIYKIMADGTNSISLLQLDATDTLTADPVWSSDMNYIYFIARIQDSLGIYKVKTDGSGAYQEVYSFDNTGSIHDYWLGLSDAISGTLPVSLLDFDATSNGKSVRLFWKTSKEINSSYFDIERSIDGTYFNKTGSLVTKNNFGAVNSYSFIDNALPVINPQSQSLQYRLKIVDKDGRFTYSKIISLHVSGQLGVAIYPNPAQNILHITGLQRVVSPISIIDITGKIIKEISSGSNLYSVDISSLSPGVYSIKFKEDKKVSSLKFIKQ